MRVDDSPAPAHLDDALELAEIFCPTWSAISEDNRRTAAFLNEGEEETDTGKGQPSPDDATPEDGNQAADEGSESSFLDDYDLGEVPEEAKPVAEAAIKRLNAAYTRKTQADAQVLRDAEQAQMIVDGLMDPDRAPAIAQALGIQIPAPGGKVEPDEFEFEDPIERIEALEQKLDQQSQVSAAEKRVQAENAYVTEQVESLETKLGVEFVDEEVELLYLLADENRDQNGAPDIEAANRLFDAAVAARHARASKPRPRAPRRPGQGSAAERKVDLDDPEKRLEAGIAAAQATLASSQ